jgi:hypothetical protein
MTGRKRWQNHLQKDKFERTEAEVGAVRMVEAIDWALLSGISSVKSIITAAKKGKPIDSGKQEHTRRLPWKVRRDDPEPTPEAGPDDWRRKWKVHRSGPSSEAQDPLAGARETGWEIIGGDEFGAAAKAAASSAIGDHPKRPWKVTRGGPSPELVSAGPHDKFWGAKVIKSGPGEEDDEAEKVSTLDKLRGRNSIAEVL